VIVPDAHPLLGGFGGLIGLAALMVIAGWAWKDRVTLAGKPAGCRTQTSVPKIEPEPK
jgi:hypothetical protein